MSPADDPPCTPEATASPAALAVGDRVRVVGLRASPEKNGLTGTVVGSVDGDRWQVMLDAAGRWAVRAAHLEKVPVPTIQPERDNLSIAGTWIDWSTRAMTWHADGRYYSFEVQLGSKGEESFQVLVNGDWKARLYPDKADGCPQERSNLCGPDGSGEGKNWTVGRHPSDRGCPGATFRVRLFLTEGGRARAVDWLRLTVPLGSYTSVCIAGTWDGWKVHEMTLDGARSLYSYEVELGKNAWESFQVLLDRDWARCLHPDRVDGCPHADHNLCGPDGSGHGKNWTIGRHPLDRGSVGARYLVRLHLPDGGRAARLDWLPLAAAPPEAAPPSSPAAPEVSEATASAEEIAAPAAAAEEAAAEEAAAEEAPAEEAAAEEAAAQEAPAEEAAAQEAPAQEAPAEEAAAEEAPAEEASAEEATSATAEAEAAAVAAAAAATTEAEAPAAAGADDGAESTGQSRGQCAGLSVPLGRYKSMFIAGTWDDWKAHEMTLDGARSLYFCEVEVGKNGWESFQVLLDRDWARCLHPDRVDGCPHADHKLCGPDGSGHGKNWTIGRHPLDNGSVGARYLVRMHLPDGDRAAWLDWLPLGSSPSEAAPPSSPAAAAEAAEAAASGAAAAEAAAAPAAAGAAGARAAEAAEAPAAAEAEGGVARKAAFIVGSWNSWAMQEMEWDVSRRGYCYRIELGTSGQESFQIVLERDWKKCLHPDGPDGRPSSALCGPDDQGHGKNWTVGLNPHRRGSPGDRYEVVLLVADGRFAGIDWSRLP